jgi:hypothetical protein
MCGCSTTPSPMGEWRDDQRIDSIPNYERFRRVVAGGHSRTLDNFMGRVGLTWSVQGFGDFNGDGTTDMIMRNALTGVLQVYEHRQQSIHKFRADRDDRAGMARLGLRQFQQQPRRNRYAHAQLEHRPRFGPLRVCARDLWGILTRSNRTRRKVAKSHTPHKFGDAVDHPREHPPRSTAKRTGCLPL